MRNNLAEYDLLVGCHGDAAGWGGAALAAHGLAQASRADAMPAFVLGMGPDRSSGGNRESVRWRNVDIAPRAGWWRIHQWRVPRRLARALRETPRPASAFVSFSPFWTVAARSVWPDLPVVVRYCGLLHHAAQRVRKLQIRRPGFWSRINELGVVSIERRALRSATRILVSTREHADEIARFEPVAAARIKEIPDGCAHFEATAAARAAFRMRLGLAESDFAILLCGSCDPNKAFEHAVEQMPRVDAPGKLIIVGDGPTRADLERRVNARGLTPRVFFLGRVADLGAAYAAADCVASTSLYDTFPNVIKEALWCGRSVIVPEHNPPEIYAGISGLVRREGGGLLYDRLRDGALAERLNELIRDRELTRKIGRQAAQVARRCFDWGNTLDEIREITDVGGASGGPRIRPHGFEPCPCPSVRE